MARCYADVCHLDDIIASKEASGRATDLESLPRLRSFREYWRGTGSVRRPVDPEIWLGPPGGLRRSREFLVEIYGEKWTESGRRATLSRDRRPSA